MKQLIKNQIKLELHHSNRNASELVKVMLKPFHKEIVKCADNLSLYLMMFNDYEYTLESGELRTREDLLEVHQSLLNKDISGLMYKLLTPVVHKSEITLQQGVGSLLGSFTDISTVSRQLKAVNLLIQYCPFITVDITKGGEYGYLQSQIELEPEEVAVLDQQSVTLPSLVPLRKLRNNSSIGFRTFKKSVLMGGKHHDFDVCLPHLNKRNRIPFVIDKEIAGRVLAGELGGFDPEPKFNKKTAKTETPMEVQERKEARLALHAHLSSKLKAIGSEPHYNPHRRDNRGRTYVEGYHYNYQGNDWQKAMVSLHTQELIEPEF
ncbi:N4-like RNA polymerase [Vibrio phage D292]